MSDEETEVPTQTDVTIPIELEIPKGVAPGEAADAVGLWPVFAGYDEDSVDMMLIGHTTGTLTVWLVDDPSLLAHFRALFENPDTFDAFAKATATANQIVFNSLPANPVT